MTKYRAMPVPTEATGSMLAKSNICHSRHKLSLTWRQGAAAGQGLPFYIVRQPREQWLAVETGYRSGHRQAGGAQIRQRVVLGMQFDGKGIGVADLQHILSGAHADAKTQVLLGVTRGAA
jgi:hypothetical protein